MTALPIASIDRRIKLLSPPFPNVDAVHRVSDMRQFPCVVLVGEPGMGKSTVLEREARALDAKHSAKLMTVRAFVHDRSGPADCPVFLDGLDEYRSDRGQRADKVEQLATRLQESARHGWWLSCRAEDWTDVDREALTRAAGDRGIVVARIEPLDETEGRAVMLARGENDPDAVRALAERLGGAAFLENPLSLSLLLVTAQASGSLPTTRFALYDGATERLSHNHDRWRGRVRRESPQGILAAAARLCGLMLLSNSGAIWHSSVPPSVGADGNGYLISSEAGVAEPLLADTLDTALFRQVENDVFVPMHRAVAEFLAGRALADAVAGGPGRPRYPLGRALALVAGADGKAPSELRGVFAWAATHLARMGRHEEAERMIRQDPVTVLIYGDAAVLTTSQRRVMLGNLDRDDPWFRSADEGDTAVGGLSGVDLEPEFRAILSDKQDGTHRFLTVTEALMYGLPVPPLQPLLRHCALDPTRSEGQRLRTAEAYIAGEGDRVAARLDLYRAASALALPDDGAIALRIQLAARLPADLPTDAELRQLLLDHAARPDWNVVGRLVSLQLKLEGNPRPALLAMPWNDQLDPGRKSTGIELQSLLDHLLAASLRAADPAPADVWSWLTNRHRFPTETAKPDVQAALQEWLANDSRRELAFFDELATVGGTELPAWPTVVFFYKVGRHPSRFVLEALLDDTSSLSVKHLSDRCLSMAIALAQHRQDADCFWAVYDHIGASTDPRAQAHLAELTVYELESWRIETAAAKAAHRAALEKDRFDIIAAFETAGADVANGNAIGLLELAADRHFGTSHDGEALEPGFARVIDLVGEELANAVRQGWRCVAMNGSGVSTAELGRAAGELKRWPSEIVAMAGLDQMLEDDDHELDQSAIELALVALKSSWEAPKEITRPRLEYWAVQRIESTPEASHIALLAFWEAALATGRDRPLAGVDLLREDAPVGGVAACALAEILRRYPSMPVQSLDSALDAAVRLIEPGNLCAIATTARASATGTQLEYWEFLAFALNPEAQQDHFVERYADKGDFDQAPLQHRAIGTLAANLETGARACFAKAVIRVLGVKMSETAWWAERVNLVAQELTWLTGCMESTSKAAVEELLADPLIAPLHPRLRHVLAEQARKRRQQAFSPESVQDICRALAGGPPLNAADLHAIVVDQLRQIQQSMQVDPLRPWRAYWSEKPKSPKVENSCRDVLGLQLQERLRPFGIDIPPMPEAQRSNSTRVDLLIPISTGANLPIEIKRHYHKDVWTAASTQLQGYAADLGASGLGVYVVFWFGSSWKRTPARPDGGVKPSTAQEMETMLQAVLPDALLRTTEIVVFDVSDPANLARAEAKESQDDGDY